MPYNPQIHHRRSIRLEGYDYTQAGAYFVTLVAQGRACLFGTILDANLALNPTGKIVAACWQQLPASFPVCLDAWMIMPNHFHGIIVISPPGKGEASAGMAVLPPRAPLADASPQRSIGTQPGSLGAILQNFKSVSTRKINQMRQVCGMPIWQRNYYEHIIRDHLEWERIRQYIRDNPRRWAQDTEYVGAKHPPIDT